MTVNKFRRCPDTFFHYCMNPGASPPTLVVVPGYSGKPPEVQQVLILESLLDTRLMPHQLYKSYFLSREKWVEPPVTVSEDKTGGIFFILG